MLQSAIQPQTKNLNILSSFLIVFVFHIILFLIISFVLDSSNNSHSANVMPFSEMQTMANDNFIEVELKEFPIEVLNDDIIEIIKEKKVEEIIEQFEDKTLDENKDSNSESISKAIGIQFKQTYIGMVIALLSKNKYYPTVERKRGREGSVVVSFVINSNGNATDIKVKEPSRYLNLDKAAIETVKRSLPFPAFEGGDKLDIVLSIDYKLDEA